MSVATLFLSFGKVSDPAVAMSREGQWIAEAGRPLGRQVALVSRGTPAFRLNSPGWLEAAPSLIAALPDRQGLRLLCRDRIEAILPAFAAAQRRWIGGYFDRLERIWPLSETTVTDQLNQPSDKFFAALLPLPTVSILPVTIKGDAITPASSDGFVTADLAVWDSDKLTAVFFGDQNTAPPQAWAALDRLVELADPIMTVRRITTGAAAEQLSDDLSKANAVPMNPCFGPYRAATFQSPLPQGA